MGPRAEESLELVPGSSVGGTGETGFTDFGPVNYLAGNCVAKLSSPGSAGNFMEPASDWIRSQGNTPRIGRGISPAHEPGGLVDG